MAKMKLHKRYLGALAYRAGGLATLELPRNYVYSGLSFCLMADVDRTASVAPGAFCKDSAPAQLVNSVEVVVNGKNTVKRLDLETMHRRNEHYHGVRPYIYAPNLAGADALDDDVSKIHAQLDFELPVGRGWLKSVDTLLDARGMSSLDLRVRWGMPNDIMNDAYDGDVTVNEAYLHVWTLERVGAPVEQYAIWKEYQHRSITLPGAGILTDNLPVNTTYESILVKTHVDGDQSQVVIPLTLALQNTIRLFSGSEVFFELPAGFEQMSDRLEKEVQAPELTQSAAAVNHALLEFPQEGYYWIDFCHDGRLWEMLDATQLGDLKIAIDCAVPGTQNVLDIYCSEIILPAVVTE